MTNSPLILHIPHASKRIPGTVRDQFIIDDTALEQELLNLTDAYTDELFCHPDATVIRADVSRLVVDVERFANDAEEPMVEKGMGVVYTHGSSGQSLRRPISIEVRTELIQRYYEPHHRALNEATGRALELFGTAHVIDCHSFPSKALQSDLDQSDHRPDICIGTDGYHTPKSLTGHLQHFFENLGYSVAINKPYSGTLVPSDYYGKDKRVESVMIEINRRLYMDEKIGDKLASFQKLRSSITSLLDDIERPLT